MSEKTTAKTDELDQGFNDDELADIMSEIENLEKEFGEDVANEASQGQKLKVEKEEVESKKTDLQAEIDNEVESLMSKESPPVAEVVTKKEEKIISANALDDAIDAIQDEMDIKESIVEEIKNEVVSNTVPEEKMDNVVPIKNIRNEIPEKKPVTITPINNMQNQNQNQTNTQTNNQTNTQTQLDFCVAGQMNLKLNFTVAGQTISLYVNDNDGMVIEMMGGARFTIPMGDTASKKKAA